MPLVNLGVTDCKVAVQTLISTESKLIYSNLNAEVNLVYIQAGLHLLRSLSAHNMPPEHRKTASSHLTNLVRSGMVKPRRRLRIRQVSTVAENYSSAIAKSLLKTIRATAADVKAGNTAYANLREMRTDLLKTITEKLGTSLFVPTVHAVAVD